MSAILKGENAPYQIRPLSSVMAGEVIGINLAKPLEEKARAHIYEAFVRYQVLAFRQQDLSKEEQIHFSEQFGTLEKHMASNENTNIKSVHEVTNLGPDGKPTGKVSSQDWHTDKSFRPLPSLATILHAKQLPPNGGETSFANMYLAYEGLTPGRQAELKDLKVVHSWEHSRANIGRTITEEEKRDAPPLAQPLVRTNPDSGRKSLFLGSHASHIEGMPFDEGRALVVELEQFATQPQFTWSHRWEAGDILMWDNRCLLHRANSNFDATKHARVMHRTCLRGSAPA